MKNEFKNEKKTSGEKQNQKEKPEKSVSKEAELEKKCKEYEDLLKRLQAEFENYKKRVQLEQFRIIKCASSDLILHILPVIDSMENALNTDKFDKDGLNILKNQFMDILSKEGLRPIESEGKKFDPYKHDVLLKEQNPDIEDEIITKEIQKGYMLNDLVLRHAKVKINKRA